jgi:hypothetical protein
MDNVARDRQMGNVTEYTSASPQDLWFVNTYWQLVQTDPGSLPGLGTHTAVSEGLRVFIGGPDR